MGKQNSNGEAPLPAVSANTLARCLGVTPKVVYDLAKEGVIERGAGRLYPLEDSVRRYCDHLRRQASGSTKTAPDPPGTAESRSDCPPTPDAGS
jgi:hypothetical protein